jgi:NAD(P)H dehydrogenase (quinone)
MSKVSIVYFSQGGTTALLAETISKGVTSAGATADLIRIEPTHITDGRWKNDAILKQLSESDAIVFGAPTFMGGVAAQFKAFADATGYIWYGRGWRGKLAGGFTISGSSSGDKLSTLQYLSILAAQHGMIWANWDELPRQPDGTNQVGAFLGLMASNPADHGTAPVLSQADVLSGEKYGRYIGATITRLENKI